MYDKFSQQCVPSCFIYQFTSSTTLERAPPATGEKLLRGAMVENTSCRRKPASSAEQLVGNALGIAKCATSYVATATHLFLKVDEGKGPRKSIPTRKNIVRSTGIDAQHLHQCYPNEIDRINLIVQRIR